MPDKNSDITLPTLRDAIAESVASPSLQCTIIFHPCVERIGQWAQLSTDKKTHTLGRQTPLFGSSPDASFAPLEDPYVSRHALSLTITDDGVQLHRDPSASRCRVAGSELLEQLFVGNAQLDAGVPLALSHTIVLLLRRSPDVRPKCSISLDGALIGSSVAMERLRKEVMRAANSDSDVLIRGETGVGKELVAQAVHLNSARYDQPMVSVNMAAVPSSLAAAALFGSAKGAFTGAEKSRSGYFQEAQGGALFLDEVGDTPEEVQPLLLRALQQREIQMVGGALRKVDVRVISATDAQLEASNCNFKSALRHRLAAMEIHVPSLAEHLEDIGELLFHFVSQACIREGRLRLLPNAQSDGKTVAQWADLFYRFACYHWPGNVRQLENFAGQVVIASEQKLTVPASVTAEIYRSTLKTEPTEEEEVSGPKRRKPREITESDFIDAMEQGLFEIATVADELGVSRRSIYRRIDASARFRRASQVSKNEIDKALLSSGGHLGNAAFNLEVSATGLRQRLQSGDAPA
ncbi:MAG: sigma 54-interacting transcriptional regulator [Halioglobus sp.]